MIDTLLDRQLAPIVEREERMRRHWRMAMSWILAGLLLMPVVGLLKSHDVFGPTSWSQWPMIVMTGVLLWLLVYGVCRILIPRRRLNAQAVAQKIEEKHPELQSLLVTAGRALAKQCPSATKLEVRRHRTTFARKGPKDATMVYKMATFRRPRRQAAPRPRPSAPEGARR